MVLQRREVLQLTLLVTCVPLQMLLASYFGQGGFPNRLDWPLLVRAVQDSFVRLAHTLFPKSMPPPQNFPDSLQYGWDDEPECPALEVLRYWDRIGGQRPPPFGKMVAPRRVRPATVRFRVGQVVRHVSIGFKGVVVGWVLQEGQVRYTLLVDLADTIRPQAVFVPQEGLKVLPNTPIAHPDLRDYFTFFDGSQFLMLPWLKVVYPQD